MSNAELRPVVVGTDGSPAATRAVEWAADEAADLGHPLHIVTASDTGVYGVPAVPSGEQGHHLAESGQAAVAAARALVQGRRPGLTVTTQVELDAPARVLVKASQDARLTVVGSRGLGGFAGLVLGSVGLRVTARAAGPVAVVPADWPGDGDPRGKGRVVVGVDMSEQSAAALEYAFETAHRRGVELQIVHAFRIDPGVLQARYLIDVRETERTMGVQLREEYGHWHTRYPGVTVTELAIQDHPVHVLAEASRDADLVVVGASGRGPVAGALLGSVGHGVLHHAHCPVVLARPEPL
ncbi:universal stress protein [Actinomadura hibisca]|uniref:universal stress protein n=1 Tax=Actinomadura hibisca TaxID=68565 RepID=UPI0008308198|nr:universal stress protein [Actinomadura hibisca]